MNQISEEISSYLGSAKMTDEEFLAHYGIPRRSGRYPYGSGKDPYQRTPDFLSRVEELKKSGWKETPENIKKEFGLTTTQYRIEKSISKDERRMLDVARAKSLRDDGKGASEIGRIMGVRESTVRNWFNEESESRMKLSRETAEFLKKQVEEKRMIDVGANVEIDVASDMSSDLRISRQKLDTALYLLEREGYGVYNNRVPQPTNPNQMTTQKVLCAKDIKPKPGAKVPQELYDYENIKTIKDYISRDGGETFEKKFHYPASMDSKRLKIRYKEEGGEDMDGLVEIRRGVKDLSLGESRYSQVRILVDGTHYIKGMAVYSDKMPDGIDVVFNTNKSNKLSTKDVLKKIKDDPENPFGSAIKDVELGGQYWYTDKDGKKKLGLINKRADEGDWSDWADTLPSQFLSKQTKQLAKKQLDLAKADKAAELDEIMSLTNPTVKKYYLDKFASSCDAAAVDLKAAALPGQKYHVIIPVNTLKDNQVYAPQYAPGTKLALVRYPHGGTFEIPIVTVTDKNPLARKIIGTDSIDAIGITAKVAARLSGADFDGDTVMCIPTNDSKGKVNVKSKRELEGLKGFDPKLSYSTEEVVDANGNKRYYRNGREVKIMKNTNNEMGKISNLITDMTLSGGATDKELAAAVRHSMVVIDAEKHKLDYKQSYIDNNIAALKLKYQTKYDKNGNIIGGGGAATIISKSKGQKQVDKRVGEARINIKGKKWYDPSKPEGSLLYTTAPDDKLYYAKSTYDKKTGIKTMTLANGKKFTYNMYDKNERDKYDAVMKKDPKTGKVTFVSKDGTLVYRTKKRTDNTTRMADTDDAMTLVSKSRHPMELLYADYANHMKAMANMARKEMVKTGNLESSPTAKKIYAKEVSELEVALNEALKNSAKERTAIRLATAEINRKKKDNPDLKGEDLRKVSQRSLAKYRAEVGSVSRKKRAINITDRQWEAIQAGAISENKLKKILNNSDPDVLRQRAMPKASNSLSTAQINRIKRLNDSNFTLGQIAEKMNLSPSTISKYLKGVN